MAEIIHIDFEAAWPNPVYIKDVDGARRRINGPDDALDALNRHWPPGAVAHGGCYSEARKRCIDVLRKRGSSQLARQWFIDAALAAGLYA